MVMKNIDENTIMMNMQVHNRNYVKTDNDGHCSKQKVNGKAKF